MAHMVEMAVMEEMMLPVAITGSLVQTPLQLMMSLKEQALRVLADPMLALMEAQAAEVAVVTVELVV